ncbi:outer membrane lipoprotein-sorting protein [Desulfurivibrio sp. C05AmB]|uniref:outer membrane lipoprotein-sorting protein n=1 Tax=Desulfurivibrio sp. C05AmB TaxID=3374371 RepID=UPI00376F2BE5
MKGFLTTAWLGAVLWLLAPAPLWAINADALLEEVDRRLQPSSYEMYRKIINIEPDGRHREFVFYTVRKGTDKMAAVFLDPPSERGRSTLRLGENMWLYIPAVGRPIRITSLQSVTGGIFSNSDILRLDFSVEYTATLLEEDERHYVLELAARSPAVAYDRLKMWVDRETISPLTIEAYAASGLLIKTLQYSNIIDFGNGVVRPATLETTSPLQEGYRSVMLFSGIRPRELPDEIFTLSFMPRIGEMRQ